MFKSDSISQKIQVPIQWGRAQDVQFWYTQSHLRAPQNRHADFQPVFGLF